MNITGDTILITGGGTGIGRGLAEALHAEGAHVIIAGRREAPLKAVADANPGIAYEILDVENPDAIKAFAVKLVKDHPALNAVINNAGVMRAEDLLAEPFDLSDAEATVAINLLGPIRLTAALLPHLREQAQATVMTVSSGLAFVPLAMTPTYCATKAAIHSYSQSLAFQLKDTSVRVIELAPPGVATDLMPGFAQDPRAMPLDAFIKEVVGLLKSTSQKAGEASEILVENVKPLRDAERKGNYEAVFGMLNPAS